MVIIYELSIFKKNHDLKATHAHENGSWPGDIFIRSGLIETLSFPNRIENVG
jgi:hypothetical protein